MPFTYINKHLTSCFKCGPNATFGTYTSSNLFPLKIKLFMLSLLIPSNHPNEHFNHTPGFYASVVLVHASLEFDSSDSTEDLAALCVPARAGSYRVKALFVSAYGFSILDSESHLTFEFLKIEPLKLAIS
jgi:hypothetical protein